jgi:hypothetical protein
MREICKNYVISFFYNNKNDKIKKKKKVLQLKIDSEDTKMLG